MADYWGRSAGWCARSTNRRQFHSLAAYRPHPQTSSAFDPRRLFHRLEDVGAGWCPIVGGEDSGARGAASRHPDRSRSAVRPRPPTRDWSRPRWAPHCVRVPIARQLNPTLDERLQGRGAGWRDPCRMWARVESWHARLRDQRVASLVPLRGTSLRPWRPCKRRRHLRGGRQQ